MTKKPYNILYIMTDQWRWDTLFKEGHICKTPNIDKFAEKSVVFNKAYTSCPLCTPARGTVFTGLWQFQNRLMDNNGPFWQNMQLHHTFKTYLERLRDDADYSVAYSGKWHCGKGTLNERGIADVRQSDGGTCEADKKYDAPPPQLKGKYYLPYYAAFTEGTHIDEKRVSAGIDQIREMNEKENPFCSVISLIGPHFDHIVPEKYCNMYELPDDFVPNNYCKPFVEKNKPKVQTISNYPAQDTHDMSMQDWKETCRHYWAFCTWLDDQIQRIFALCDELDLWENTVIAFCPDHGEMLGAHGKFDKGPDFYEETTHIPMIVYDPDNRTPQNPDSFVSIRDLYPTLITLAGTNNILQDEEKNRSYWETDKDHVFMTYDQYHGREYLLRGIRTEKYKYTWLPNDLCELYDLEADPGEMKNLINDPELADTVKELDAKVKTWMQQEGDYLSSRKWYMEPGAYIDGRSADQMHPWHAPAFPKRG